MTNMYLLILILVSIVLGLISWFLAKTTLQAESAPADGYQPTTMGLLSCGFMLIAGLVASQFGYGCLWVAMGILALWVFAAKHCWTSVAIAQLIPLAAYGFWLISKAQGGTAPSGTPVLIHILFVVGALAAIIIDNRVNNGTGDRNYRPMDILRAVMYVVVIAAGLVFLYRALIAA